MEKLYSLKTFLKMAGGRMHTPHLNPVHPPMAISYRNHQKSLAYFSHFAPLTLFFFMKRQNQKGGGRAWHHPPLNTHLVSTLRGKPPPPPLKYKLMYISSQRNSENRTSKNDLFFWSSLDFGGKLDDKKLEDLCFLGLHRHFQWIRKQEIAAPPFSNFWARP